MAVESHRLAVLGEAVTRMEGLSRLLRNKCTHLSLVESLEQWLGEVRVVLQGAAGGPARAGTGCGGAGQEGLTGKAGEWRGLEADCLYEVLMQQEEVVEVPSSSSSP